MLKLFSTVVERARSLQQGSTTVEFARMLGMTQQTVDLYMKGERKPSLEFVYRLCSAYNISADWLLGLASTNVEGRKRGLTTRIKELKADAEQATAAISKLQAVIKKLDADLQDE